MKEIVEKILNTCKQKFNTHSISNLTFSQRKSLKVDLSNIVKHQDIIMLKEENFQKFIIEDYSSICLKKNFKSLPDFIKIPEKIKLMQEQFRIKNKELIIQKYKHPQLKTIFEDSSGKEYVLDMSLTHSSTIPDIQLNQQNFNIIKQKTDYISDQDVVGNLAEQRLGKTMTWVDGTVDLKRLIDNDFQLNYGDKVNFYLEKNKNKLEELVVDKLIDFAECIKNNSKFINYDVCAYYMQQIMEILLVYNI